MSQGDAAVCRVKGVGRDEGRGVGAQQVLVSWLPEGEAE